MNIENEMCFESRATKSKVFCCVFGCNSMVDRRKAWEISLKMGKKVTPRLQVCSLHFQKDDYILPDAAASKACLKKTAVPSCNLAKCSVEVPKNQKVKRAREE